MVEQWRVYQLEEPIDVNWEMLRTVETVKHCMEQMVNKYGPNYGFGVDNFNKVWETGLEVAKSIEWDGKFNEDEEPSVFCIPSPVEFKFGFVFKQGKYGTTFVIAPAGMRSIPNYFEVAEFEVVLDRPGMPNSNLSLEEEIMLGNALDNATFDPEGNIKF